jgi:hypothetical protein
MGLGLGINVLVAEMENKENHCLVKVMMDRAVGRDVIY